jgi:4-hydroxy-tetrahydrodipicolinate synthase
VAVGTTGESATVDVDEHRHLMEFVVERAKGILARVPASFAVYSGDDATAVELMLMGGQGDISVTANVAPAELHAMTQAALKRDAASARTQNERLAELHKVLFVESNPIPVKWALHEMGRISTGIRLPLTPLSEKHRPVIRDALARAGLLGAR